MSFTRGSLGAIELFGAADLSTFCCFGGGDCSGEEERILLAGTVRELLEGKFRRGISGDSLSDFCASGLGLSSSLIVALVELRETKRFLGFTLGFPERTDSGRSSSES